jgi:ADP-ribosylglycohydrolase
VTLDRLHGAWLGRAAGCLLGKPVEKIPREGIREILTATGRWPLRDWFTAKGLPAEVAARWPWNRRSAATSLAENIDGMPEDDDLNFALLALRLLETAGRDFTGADVAEAWLAWLPAGRVFTAERVAYRNLLLGLEPPRTARRHNPFREWIGAQIRTDVYGWVNPGRPDRAAELAWRDAAVSHVRAGVYGAIWVAAMAAAAPVAAGIDEVLDAGESVLPPGSRFTAAVRDARALAATTGDWERIVDTLHERHGHLHWVHVRNNAALVAAALAHGGGDLERSICAAVSGGWDTDSTGATVGALTGALTGAAGLPRRWVDPLRGRLASSIAGFDGIGFDELAARTLALAEGGAA